MDERAAILANEFTRPPQPGLRLLTAGIIEIGRQLELAVFLNKEGRKARERSALDKHLEDVAVTWLLDEKTPESLVYDLMQRGGRSYLFDLLPGYERRLSPVLVALAQAEMGLTMRAIEAALYEIAPKPAEPGTKAPPSPPPN